MKPFDARIHNSREGGASFPFRHRLFRFAWGVIWGAFGIWTPVPLHGWRRLLLRAFGARLAVTARVYPGVKIWYPPNLEMDSYACLGPGVTCYCMDVIRIGHHAVVSQGTYLCGGSHDIDDVNFQIFTRQIIIGANAWVAAQAFIGPGVTVGEGAVVGARAVSMKDVAPWSVVAGNPARVLRQRKRHDTSGD